MYNFQVHNVNLHTHTHTQPYTHRRTHTRTGEKRLTQTAWKRLAGRFEVPEVPDTRFPDSFVPPGVPGFYFRTRCHDVASTSWPGKSTPAAFLGPPLDEQFFLPPFFSSCYCNNCSVSASGSGLNFSSFPRCSPFVMQFLWGDKMETSCLQRKLPLKGKSGWVLQHS